MGPHEGIKTAHNGGTFVGIASMLIGRTAELA
jgi:hypothetical protein